ncbi:dihydrofolate reductase family protein [Kribbella sp. VKM Ac-2568]|uniref:dihydrofolate reductase family protein n=1 Tax=Kribbella sp. VKM Ac-2568 TaxID=2512219 RepID=UPI00104A119E|nr:dihydrofolate reductase family protein [Kribbella sp. VKM Ac-2568]TCM46935.1 RibD domain-containing protein [Kribbella sp. VKM Ac-2568]
MSEGDLQDGCSLIRATHRYGDANRPVHRRTRFAQAKVAAGDKYVNVLGANIARQCLEAGALDEILVCIAPVMLGDGVRMFDHPGGRHIKLERLTQSEARLATNLWFRRQLGRMRRCS